MCQLICIRQHFETNKVLLSLFSKLPCIQKNKVFRIYTNYDLNKFAKQIKILVKSIYIK